jgi:hypothetical protein
MRSSLAVCKTIPGGITADNFLSYANTFDACVTSTASAYSTLKDRSGSNPTYMPFVEKVTSLSRVYIANMNKPPRN